jgi:hypothetical protein
MLNNIPSTSQGNSMFENAGSSQSITGMTDVEKICQSLKQLIDKETQKGDSKAAAKLQDAYDMIEEYKTEPTETGSPEGSDQDQNGTGEAETTTPAKTLDTSLLMGPMDKLKNYLAQKSVNSGNRNG